MSRQQLNSRVAGKLKRQVALEKVKANTTQDIIIEVALENLFSGFSPERRATFYAAHNHKPYRRAV